MATRRGRRAAGVHGARVDPRSVVRVDLVCDGPSKGWLHTHGLAAFGHPELEIRGLPLFLGSAATALLNDLAGYLLNDATRPLVPGQLVSSGRCSIQVVLGRPDEEAGYDEGHYRDVRLTLVDPPPHGFECDDCAREAAARMGFRS